MHEWETEAEGQRVTEHTFKYLNLSLAHSAAATPVPIVTSDHFDAFRLSRTLDLENESKYLRLHDVFTPPSVSCELLVSLFFSSDLQLHSGVKEVTDTGGCGQSWRTLRPQRRGDGKTFSEVSHDPSGQKTRGFTAQFPHQNVYLEPDEQRYGRLQLMVLFWINVQIHEGLSSTLFFTLYGLRSSRRKTITTI